MSLEFSEEEHYHYPDFIKIGNQKMDFSVLISYNDISVLAIESLENCTFVGSSLVS